MREDALVRLRAGLAVALFRVGGVAAGVRLVPNGADDAARVLAGGAAALVLVARGSLARRRLAELLELALGGSDASWLRVPGR